MNEYCLCQMRFKENTKKESVDGICVEESTEVKVIGEHRREIMLVG